MGGEGKISTSLKFEGGKIYSLFDSRPGIETVGLSKISGNLNAWSPPHLLLASIESCFLLTMFSIADKMRIGIKSYSSTVEGDIASEDGKHYEVKNVVIRPRFVLDDEDNRSKLKILAEKAGEYCLVAKSLKERVRIEL